MFQNPRFEVQSFSNLTLLQWFCDCFHAEIVQNVYNTSIIIILLIGTIVGFEYMLRFEVCHLR